MHWIKVKSKPRFYRPSTKLWKVMFSLVSVCLFMEGSHVTITHGPLDLTVQACERVSAITEDLFKLVNFRTPLPNLVLISGDGY